MRLPRLRSIALGIAVLARLEKDWQASLEGDEPFAHDILILSGGGAKGAFGAGFLQGWGTVTEGPTVRPEFDVVTGVSTGALIAPFAFVGSDKAYVKVVDFYADPPHGEMFNRGFMIQLEALGHQLGADPSSWHTKVPEIHWLDEF